MDLVSIVWRNFIVNPLGEGALDLQDSFVVALSNMPIRADGQPICTEFGIYGPGSKVERGGMRDEGLMMRD